MASANVELVRWIYAAWARGDFSSAEWAHPEIELVVADGPTPGSWTGRDGLAAGWRAIVSAFDGYRVEPVGYRQLGDERVLVLVRRRGHGKTSGLDLEAMTSTGATIFRLRDRQVIKLVLYFDSDHALADLSLVWDDDSPAP